MSQNLEVIALRKVGEKNRENGDLGDFNQCISYGGNRNFGLE